MLLNFIFRSKYLKLITIILYCHIQLLSAQDIKESNNYPNHRYKKIYIESSSIEIHKPGTIKLLGNVFIRQNDNIIKSDKLIIYDYYNFNKNILGPILYAEGNIFYKNSNIILTGMSAQLNLYNYNTNIYNSTYYITKNHIYGSARSIMQRKNNRFTIIKKGDCTTCVAKKNYWNIVGSKIAYDHFNKQIYIWDACLKIKKIPLFYSPYLSLTVDNNNILESYLPTIQYSNKRGLIFKTPFPMVFSKYYSGNISPYYISNTGIGLNTEIHYKVISNAGLLIYKVEQNYLKNNIYNYKKNYELFWKHRGIINKKWHINANYVLKNNFKSYSENFKNKYPMIINNDINQKILFYYNNKYCKISMAHFGYLNTYQCNSQSNSCIYSASPQLEMHLFFDYNQKNCFNFQILNQISKFIPSDYIYPKTIRIHTEPIINFNTYKNGIRLNTEARLKITHYQQNNINYYNTIQNNQKLYLQNKVNRIIPQFKINGEMIFQKNTKNSQKYKYSLKPKLQYLYIPYIFQENIGIYDTKIIHLDHHNLFYGAKYSGLDRIAHTNQITGNITIHCLNQYNDQFYISIGQILYIFQNKDNIKPYLCISNMKNLKIQLYSSGIGYCKINNCWSVCAEISYDTLSKIPVLGNASLEYMDKNHIIFQTNYRYISSRYFQKNLINYTYPTSKYYQTISQLGVIMYRPITPNWIISYSIYHNIKTNFLISATTGIGYITPCWIFGVIFEHNTINRNNTLYSNLYENKIRIQLNLIDTKTNLKSNIYKFLDAKIIPYQHILNPI